MNWFSHVYHGKRYCSWARTHDDDDGDGGGVAQHGGHTPIIDWQRHAALVYCVRLWYRTSMLWSTDTCQNKVSADQYHVTISRAQVYNSSRSRVFPKLTADQMMIFDWIAGSCPVNLLKPGRIVWKPANASPGLKFISNNNFLFSTKVFFLLLLLLCFMFINSKQKTSSQVTKLKLKFYLFLG